jgi:predicted PurR-regulated permease PerM
MTQLGKPATDKNGSPPPKPRKIDPELPTRTQAEVGGARERGARVTLVAFDPWMRAGQVSVIGLFLIALVWCAYVAQPVIVPVLLAWAIATIVLPLVKWMEARRVPRVLAAVAVTVLLVALIVSLLALLSTPVAYWLGRATELGSLIKQKMQTMSQPLALLDELRKALNIVGSGGAPTLKVEQSATVLTTIFSVLTPASSSAPSSSISSTSRGCAARPCWS